jgi:hypothetical protein
MKYITKKTKQPFTITRTLAAWDEKQQCPVCLNAVKITVESADFSKDVWEEEGFSGDWCVHLSDDPRWSSLPEDVKLSAADAAHNALEELASLLAHGKKVPVIDTHYHWYKN